MIIEELFAQAKKEIFGEMPDCRFTKVGYNMAHIYYNKLIEDAEAVSQGIMIPYMGFSESVEKACHFGSEPDLDAFPDEIKNYLLGCSDRFRQKYSHLSN